MKVNHASKPKAYIPHRNGLRPFYGPFLEPDNIKLCKAYKRASRMVDPGIGKTQRAGAAIGLYKMLFDDPSLSASIGVTQDDVVKQLETAGRVSELHQIGAIAALFRISVGEMVPDKLRIKALALWCDLYRQIKED
ncbi:MAG: hypothetical protein ACP5NX_01530 [Candidatus Bilamarchaeaceae archaeon]